MYVCLSVSVCVWRRRLDCVGTGIPAAVACPVSCGTCGIGLCYEDNKFKSCKLSTYSTDELDEEA